MNQVQQIISLVLAIVSILAMLFTYFSKNIITAIKVRELELKVDKHDQCINEIKTGIAVIQTDLRYLKDKSNERS